MYTPNAGITVPSWASVAIDFRDNLKLDNCTYNNLIWYLGLCELKGFANTNDIIRLCAERYIAGKRKVTAPGTQRKKDAEKKRKKLLQNIPAELLVLLDKVCQSEPAKQFANGNDKAINQLVGMIMREYKTDAALLKDLLTKRLR